MDLLDLVLVLALPFMKREEPEVQSVRAQCYMQRVLREVDEAARVQAGH